MTLNSINFLKFCFCCIHTLAKQYWGVEHRTFRQSNSLIFSFVYKGHAHVGGGAVTEDWCLLLGLLFSIWRGGGDNCFYQYLASLSPFVMFTINLIWWGGGWSHDRSIWLHIFAIFWRFLLLSYLQLYWQYNEESLDYMDVEV